MDVLTDRGGEAKQCDHFVARRRHRKLEIPGRSTVQQLSDNKTYIDKPRGRNAVMARSKYFGRLHNFGSSIDSVALLLWFSVGDWKKRGIDSRA